ncbi:hypothetical protein [Geminocystis sp. GBBB08]|uniref:hypothetical protein n=1 Tax=Geminocystis sp. GBBB08 TaxID=2604140 RepID=UPI0027E26D29|nr:hypothetical protein [Geminocystis sp. GBBB08]MBL1210139.1 hypothetical protein [Geminocystis sp. GBBB08]
MLLNSQIISYDNFLNKDGKESYIETYTYDQYGNPIELISESLLYPARHYTSWDYTYYNDDKLKEVIVKKYDPDNNLVSVSIHTYSYLYNDSGYLTQFIRVENDKFPKDSRFESYLITYTYNYTFNENGNLIKYFQDRDHPITYLMESTSNYTYTYDENGNLINESQGISHAKGGDSKEHIYSYTFDDNGYLTKKVRNSEVSGYYYSAVGIKSYLTTSIYENNGTLTLEEETIYYEGRDKVNDYSTLIYDNHRNLINTLTSNGSIVTYTYDDNGNLIKTVFNSNNDSIASYIINYTYDEKENLTLVLRESAGIIERKEVYTYNNIINNLYVFDFQQPNISELGDEELNTTINGQQGNDILSGDVGNNSINGKYGDDWIFGNQGDDVVSGGSGNDIIYGGNGNDVVNGGRKNDVLFGNQGYDLINGDDGDDIIYGGNDNDILNGQQGNDFLSGDLENDSLTGGEGSDIFFIGEGKGIETISDFTDGVDLIALSHGLTFNNLVLFDDYISVNGQIIARLNGIATNVLTADDFITQENLGNDYGIFYFGDVTNDVTISGGNNNDNINTGSGNDNIHAGNGNNIINAGGGNDEIFGSVTVEGKNQIDGGEGFDTVIYDRELKDFDFTLKHGILQVANNGDTLINIEQIQFSDQSVLVENLPQTPLVNIPIYRFQNRDIRGVYLFVGEEERQNIIVNYPNFIEEGEAFKVGMNPDDDLIVMNRFQNKEKLGTYLYAGEEESINIRTNYPNFVEEGIAFYVYDGNAGKGVDFYRFQNKDIPGVYIFVGEAERQNIIANYPNFIEEGIAFEVLI